ncbi:recombinase family protein [Flexibacterium corallicola]|uniref:recombinase family protein n=1 Tax=Flexibacterium corallicola TaxID=3037259 RepID=UPI00286F8191|nr:recombinase family protein [Pseudovibrio sp. M1P-2-3]
MKLGYARVSTGQQNTARQLTALQGAGVDLENIVTDEISGADKSRPGLTELLIKIRRGDCVTVASMDRLARSLTDLHEIVGSINDKGAAVHFVKENLTCAAQGADAMGTLILNIMGSFAQFERSLINERQAEGISAAKQRGVYKGGVPTINREKVQALVEAGFNNSQIARKLGKHRSSIIRIKKELKIENSTAK